MNPEIITIIMMMMMMNTTIKGYYWTGTVLGSYIIISNPHNDSSKWLAPHFVDKEIKPWVN